MNHFLSKKVDLVNFSSFHKIASVFAFFGIFATSSLEIYVSKTSALKILMITWHDDGWFRNCIYQEYEFLLRSNASFSFKMQSDSRNLRNRRSHDQLAGTITIILQSHDRSTKIVQSKKSDILKPSWAIILRFYNSSDICFIFQFLRS